MTVIEAFVKGMTFEDILALVAEVDGDREDGAWAALRHIGDMATDYFLTPANGHILARPAVAAITYATGMLAFRQSPFAAYPLKYIVGPARERQHAVLSNIATLRKVEAYLREQVEWSYRAAKAVPPDVLEDRHD